MMIIIYLAPCRVRAVQAGGLDSPSCTAFGRHLPTFRHSHVPRLDSLLPRADAPAWAVPLVVRRHGVINGIQRVQITADPHQGHIALSLLRRPRAIRRSDRPVPDRQPHRPCQCGLHLPAIAPQIITVFDAVLTPQRQHRAPDAVLCVGVIVVVLEVHTRGDAVARAGRGDDGGIGEAADVLAHGVLVEGCAVRAPNGHASTDPELGTLAE